MNFADNYLARHKAIIPDIEEPPSGLLYFIVVIPAYFEDKILNTLNSLKNTSAPAGHVEIIVVVNYSDRESEENKLFHIRSYHELKIWCKSNSTLRMRFYPMLAADLPSKHAGVGLARKVGMDQACKRFNQIGRPEGIILSFDADSKVTPSYFTAIEKNMIPFDSNNYGGCIIQFEHPTEGDEFASEVYEAIIHYELHLRYYKHILQFSGFPYSYYTIGSCFGVKASFYAEQGGMNRRQAGEDFYFLNKLFPHKRFAFITDTCVYPSPRPSFRVPFGTGAAVLKIISNKEYYFQSYSPQAFFDLKVLFNSVEKIYDSATQSVEKLFVSFPETLKNFLLMSGFYEKIDEIRKNTNSFESFQKRFFLWFDGFKVVKFLNYCHQHFYSKIPVENAVKIFLEEKGNHFGFLNNSELLKYFRELDKGILDR
jgi:hypothetical protein